MYRTILTILLFICTTALFTANAQQVYGEPIENIEKRLLEDTTLFDRLGARMLAGDTSLTMSELTTVYYGSVFRADYNPYLEKRVLDAGSALARREKMAESISLFDNLLKKNPACLAGWLEKAYMLLITGDSLQTDKVYAQYRRFLDVPMKSGTGASPETAFVVRSIEDEGLILDELGYVPKDRALMNRNGQRFHGVTCYKDGEDQDKVFDLYFNIELPLMRGIPKRE